MYLERHNHLPKKQRALTARIKLITKSFVALLRHAYIKEGLIGIFKNIVVTVAHLDIVLMMTRSDTKHLLNYHPDLLNGDLSHPYLSTAFNNSRATRCTILISHYTYLAARLKETFYEQAAERNLVLWRAVIEGDLLSICVTVEKLFRHEGDLTLIFETNHEKIYQLSFTIVPGRLVGCSVPYVLLIGRVQGVKERLEEIRLATKSCERYARDASRSSTDTPPRAKLSHEEPTAGNSHVAPPYLLVTAAQAIALELDVSLVAGVNSREHLSNAVDFPFDYDSFWKTCFATKTNRNFYVFPASFVGKSSDHISSNHRRRKQLTRQFKGTVNECIRVAFAEKCLIGNRLERHSRKTIV